MSQLQSITVLMCGTCLHPFEREADLRQHQKDADKVGDRHDGEPWGKATVSVGDVVTWERHTPRAMRRIEVVGIHRNVDGEVFVRTSGGQGVAWNELPRYLEAIATTPRTARTPAPKATSPWRRDDPRDVLEPGVDLVVVAPDGDAAVSQMGRRIEGEPLSVLNMPPHNDEGYAMGHVLPGMEWPGWLWIAADWD